MLFADSNACKNIIIYIQIYIQIGERLTLGTGESVLGGVVEQKSKGVVTTDKNPNLFPILINFLLEFH